MIVYREQRTASEPPLEMGVVVEIQGDVVRVQPHRHNACEACGSSTFCFPEHKQPLIVEANRTGEVKVGDLVELRHREAPRIFAALTLFGLPVLTVILGLIVGSGAGGQETQGGLAGALAGLMLGIILVRFINRLVRANLSLRPNIGSVLDPQKL